MVRMPFCISSVTVLDFSVFFLHPVQPSGHYMYRTVVTIRTVPHSGHYIYHQINIQQFYVLPTQCIYVFCVDLRTNSDNFPIQH